MKRVCPVVAVTAFTDESVRKKCLSLGMKSVLQKPVEFDKLKVVVDDLYYDKKLP